MTQALYAHMNNKTIKKIIIRVITELSNFRWGEEILFPILIWMCPPE
jgi:hypothetical protein